MANFYTNINDTSGYTEAFYNSWTTGYEHILQEKKPAYQGLVIERPLVGEYQSFDFLGDIELDDKAARFEDIPIEDILHNRRWIFPKWARKGIFVDNEDQIALHSDPSSAYMQALAKAVIRKENKTITDAFFADVGGGKNPNDDTFKLRDNLYVYSTRITTGGRTLAHDVQADYTAGGVSTGLTIEKLILARQALLELENDADDMFYVGCAPKQGSDLLREAETQSIDTNMIKSLTAGVVNEYMGFRFVFTNRIAVGALNDVDVDTNVYELPVWTKETMLFARHMSPIFSVDWIPRKQVFQIAARCGMNAIRLDECKIIKIECI